MLANTGIGSLSLARRHLRNNVRPYVQERNDSRRPTTYCSMGKIATPQTDAVFPTTILPNVVDSPLREGTSTISWSTSVGGRSVVGEAES